MTNRDSKLITQFNNSKRSKDFNDRLVLAMDSLLSMVGTDQETKRIHRDIYDLSHIKDPSKSRYFHKRINKIIRQLKNNIDKLNNYTDHVN